VAYSLHLDRQDLSALAYIAGRYESGRVLYGHLEIARDADEAAFQAGHRVEWKLSEPGAWEYMDALHEEDGDPIIPPLAGGHLASVLIDLYQKIV
jgi:hypothetical protein